MEPFSLPFADLFPGMDSLTIRYRLDVSNEPCVLCGEVSLQGAGPALTLADGRPVCRACGQESAPKLATLLDLAKAAERVGRVCRHILVPSMESLLDLARAAENYADTTNTPVGRAA